MTIQNGFELDRAARGRTASVHARDRAKPRLGEIRPRPANGRQPGNDVQLQQRQCASTVGHPDQKRQVRARWTMRASARSDVVDRRQGPRDPGVERRRRLNYGWRDEDRGSRDQRTAPSERRSCIHFASSVHGQALACDERRRAGQKEAHGRRYFFGGAPSPERNAGKIRVAEFLAADRLRHRGFDQPE